MLLGERASHEAVERDTLLCWRVGHNTGLSKVGALDHGAVDKAETATIEGIEEFEFDTRGLISDKDIDLSLTNQTVERLIIGIGDKGGTRICSNGISEPITWISPRHNKTIASISKDLLEKIANSLLVLWHREVAVIESIVALARKGTRLAIAMTRGQQNNIATAKVTKMSSILVGDSKNAIGSQEHRLIATKFGRLYLIIETTPRSGFGLCKRVVIVVLDIMGSHIYRMARGVEMFEQGAAVKSFKENGIVILLQPSKQLARLARLDDIGPVGNLAKKACATAIVVHLLAHLLKSWRRGATIGITMKVYLHACLSESLDAIIDIDDPAIIGRPWNVESDNVEMHRQAFLLGVSNLNF